MLGMAGTSVSGGGIFFTFRTGIFGARGGCCGCFVFPRPFPFPLLPLPFRLAPSFFDCAGAIDALVEPAEASPHVLQNTADVTAFPQKGSAGMKTGWALNRMRGKMRAPSTRSGSARCGRCALAMRCAFGCVPLLPAEFNGSYRRRCDGAGGKVQGSETVGKGPAGVGR